MLIWSSRAFALVAVLSLGACGRTELLAPASSAVTKPCALELAPTELFLGTLSPGVAAEGRVQVQNAGTGLCLLDSVALASDSDPWFTLPGAPAGAVGLKPGDTLTFVVRFQSTGAVMPPLSRTGTLVFETNDPLRPVLQVHLSAKLKLCQLAVPAVLDFGNVALNTTLTNGVQVTNRATTTVT